MAAKVNLIEIPSSPVQGTYYPQGEFITGCADIMIGKGKDGTMMRVFYPSTVGDIKMVPTDKWTRWYLGMKHSTGSCRFFTKHFVPVYAAIAHYLQSNTLTPSVWDAPIANEGSAFPLVVFSHGLASNRAMHSGIGSDLASYGFIVAAVEHRDGSAAATFTYSPEGEENWTLHENVPVDQEVYEERRDQNDIRAKECSRVLDVMSQLNAGRNLINELKSNFDLRTLKGKIDLSSPVVAGQSYGGATAILSMVDKRFKLGIILDPWMFPLRDRVEQLGQNITQPMLFILMAKFQTEKNIKFMKPFEKENNLFYTLRKGNHIHQSDMPVIFSRHYSIIQRSISAYGPKLPAEVLVTINSVLMKKFIFKNIKVRPDYVEAANKFLAKYDSILSEGALASCKAMKGWDY